MVDPPQCIRPVRGVMGWPAPPHDSVRFRRVAFEPMLYLALWLSAVIIIIVGDIWNVPPVLADTDSGAHFLAWSLLSLICPPLALIASRIIGSAGAAWAYRGMWLRLAADSGQAGGLAAYTLLRLEVGDFHVLPVATMLACLLFVVHLVFRDVGALINVERVTRQVERNAGR